MLDAPDAARYGLGFLLLGFARRSFFGLCLFLFTEFGVTGFPAVGDLGQELADVLDFGVGPAMKFVGANVEHGWCWDFSISDVVRKRCEMYAQPFGGFAGRDDFHFSTMYMIGKLGCQAIWEETNKVR